MKRPDAAGCQMFDTRIFAYMWHLPYAPEYFRVLQVAAGCWRVLQGAGRPDRQMSHISNIVDIKYQGWQMCRWWLCNCHIALTWECDFGLNGELACPMCLQNMVAVKPSWPVSHPIGNKLQILSTSCCFRNDFQIIFNVVQFRNDACQTNEELSDK